MDADYEKLGIFYLGRETGENGETNGPLLLYPSSDLLTHALCVGMTGSGKTGLCVDILEEAAIDGIPAIIVDPKGDMTNLCLQFPNLSPEDYLPWISEDEARNEGSSREALAAQKAEIWQKGLARWDQTADRMLELRRRTDITVYTPASSMGVPLSISNLSALPSEATRADREAYADLVTGTAQSLLGLLGIDGDEMNSREFILLSNILQDAWNRGQSLDLPSLIAQITKPPFKKVGVLDLDSYYPEKDRFQLALRFNNLLASPSFCAWMEGEPLDIDRLLYNEDGKPRLAILSIAHLSENERIFFVALLLNRLLAWTRSQSGSSSLRALFYMDEIFGYFPPVQNPPTKKPLLTLLKQARAYGLGIMLTTQNPVDLDYKGLSNIGTWFIGRLQTDNDRKRLLDGLQTLAAADGNSFSRADMDRLLAGLGKRRFLLNNIHASGPAVFETRHALSYLKGPLSRDELRLLRENGLYSVPQSPAPYEATAPADRAETPFVQPEEAFPAEAAPQANSVPFGGSGNGETTGAAPQLPPGIPVYVLPGQGRRYRAAVGALCSVFYPGENGGDDEQEFRWTLIDDGVLPVDWSQSEASTQIQISDLRREVPAGAVFMEVPQAALNQNKYKKWENELIDWLYRNKSSQRFRNRSLKVESLPGEDSRAFRIRLDQESRDLREKKLQELRGKYESKIKALDERLRKAEQAVEREKDQAKDAKRQAAISLGSTVLSAVFGKILGAGTLGKAATTGRSASRITRSQADVGRAEETADTLRAEADDLRAKMETDLAELQTSLEATVDAIEAFEIKPLKKDIKLQIYGLYWVPEN